MRLDFHGYLPSDPTAKVCIMLEYRNWHKASSSFDKSCLNLLSILKVSPGVTSNPYTGERFTGNISGDDLEYIHTLVEKEVDGNRYDYFQIMRKV